MENKENLWLQRFKDYLKTYKDEYGIPSWWLRLEHEHEDNSTTTMINYYLDKSVKKGLLEKETTKSYSKYFLK